METGRNGRGKGRGREREGGSKEGKEVREEGRKNNGVKRARE